MNFSKIFKYPIYEVGGCVRDSLLGLPNKDVDIASDLAPAEFKKLCKSLGYKTHDTGIEHGTITVMINGTPYEHTTFRKDVSCDGRNATIEFSKTIEEDLSRRDFTINAIAKLGSELIDPFNGREDLKHKILRAVGNPEERFSEDYLRIVRAARFKSRLQLEADETLKDAAIKLSPNIIKHVSIERITDEIRKAKMHGREFFTEAESLGFLKCIFPEVLELSEEGKNNWLSQIEHSQDDHELISFASILIPLYQENAENKAALLKMSRQLSKGIGLLFKLKDCISQSSSTSDLRDLMLEAKDYYEDLKTYITKIHDPSDISKNNISRIEAFEHHVKESIDNPMITGDYLLKSSLKPSPFFKEVLTACGKLQAEGKTIDEVKKLADKLISSKA